MNACLSTKQPVSTTKNLHDNSSPGFFPTNTISPNTPTPSKIGISSANVVLNPSQTASQNLPEELKISKPVQPSATIQSTPSPLPADYWMTLPIIPGVSQTSREIYQRGQKMGRDPHSFSKIGDCQSITTYFLSNFELPGYYDLGENSSLQDTLTWFAGSFSRESLAVKGGYNAAAILSPLRADPKQCNSSENPIQCEFRLHNPSIALISLEEWWSGHPENYEKYLRQIIEYTIQQGIVPIVATKADNLEGNQQINQTIAKLAIEYDIPLWNFWLAVQPLENHGLISVDSKGSSDMFHLTHSNNFFFYNNLSARQSGWSVRNLTALQVIDAVWRGLSSTP
jgi:hypothetical protein